jgi:cobalamin synthase
MKKMMTMNQNFEELQKRTKRYWYTDGLNEIAFGFICLILGLYFLAQVLLPQDSLISNLLTAGFVLLVLGSAFLTRWMVTTLKERLTYPRTGYVSYAKPGARQNWLTAIIGMLFAVLLVAFFTTHPASQAWMSAVSGLIFAAVWGIFAYRLGLSRFYFIAATALIFGAIPTLTGMQEILGLATFYGLIGLAMFVSGGLTLKSYLENTNPAAED